MDKLYNNHSLSRVVVPAMLHTCLSTLQQNSCKMSVDRDVWSVIVTTRPMILATLQITSYALGVYITLLFTCQLHNSLIKLYFK